MVKEITITNTDFYFMIENQIRNKMSSYEEVWCLPHAENILKTYNISYDSLDKYPIEGYYYQTENLKKFFTIVRNLQHNKKLIDSISIEDEDLKFLQRVCDNDIFGIVDPTIDPNKKVILKRRFDILTLTMSNEFSQITSTHPWTINNILLQLSKYYDNRTNLVELAYLTGDPKCLCCGAETNSLYRMFAGCTGSYCISNPDKPIINWKVTPEVEELGSRLVNEYNKIIGGQAIYLPSIKNHEDFTKTPTLPRVALLGYVTSPGLYYHWILDENGNLTDVYDTNVITTESYIKNKQPTSFSGRF